MAPREQDRDDIRRALGEVVGDEIADRIMENLPPFPWHDVARQGDLVAMRSDIQALAADLTDLRADVTDLRADVTDLRADVTDLRADVTDLRADVTDLRADVDELTVDVRVIRETLDHRFDALRDGLSAQFHADLLAHSRVMYFSMIGAVFTSASLAFAAVRL